MTMVCATAVAAHAKPSNPAFLGIGMHDAAPGQNVGPCVVDTVTRGSGAKSAGLREGDQLQTFDGQPVINCDAVLHVVQSHESGDAVKIGVVRGARPMTLTANLWSRDEIMRRR